MQQRKKRCKKAHDLRRDEIEFLSMIGQADLICANLPEHYY